MLAELAARLREVRESYEEMRGPHLQAVVTAVEQAQAELARLVEFNAETAKKTRVAYSFRDGMTRGGGEATYQHDQLRNLLENQARALSGVLQNLQRVAPAVGEQINIADRMLSVLEA